MKLILNNIIILILITSLVVSQDDFCDEGWIAYSGQKCFKVIVDNKTTEEEAIKYCQSLSDQAQLMSIHTQNDSQFLSNELSKYNNISDNVWIGLKYTDKAWKWLDMTALDYDNWSDDAVKDGSNPCAVMSITKSSLGQWNDMSCNKKSLFVCQRKQSSLRDVVSGLKTLTSIVDKQQIQLNEQKNMIEEQQKLMGVYKDELAQLKQTTVPIGFIYTQLPNQSAPHDLWPQTNWTDVSKEYSGLFFRVEGGDGFKFEGGVQPANQSWISHVVKENVNAIKGKGNHFEMVKVVQGQFTDTFSHNDYEEFQALGQLKLFTTLGETRPINTAIRIWKRIQ